MAKTLNQSFYKRDDVVQVAQDLLGKVLVTSINGKKVKGTITETEAYCGLTDSACHAKPDRKTKRTEIFFEGGGLAYVYLCYGIHNLFNIITGPKEVPQAVLIRAVDPLAGLSIMEKRRKTTRHIADGPGKLSQAFGILKSHNGVALWHNEKIWLEDHGFCPEFKATPRIGIDYAGEDAQLPWRFVARP